MLLLSEFTLPEPSTANPISTEYNQKSRKSFCNLGLASLMGGKRLVSYRRNKNEHKKMAGVKIT